MTSLWLAGSLVLLSSPAPAVETLGNLKIGGFIRAGAAISDSEAAYNKRINRDGYFGDSQLGINLSAAISTDWTAAAQLFASGGEHNFQLLADWSFVSYRPNDSLTFNFGKVKFPNNLIAEYYDIGIAYPWLRPPQEFYTSEELGAAHSNMKAFNGATAMAHTEIADVDYSALAFVGESPGEHMPLKKMLGASLSAATDAFTVQASYHRGSAEQEEEGAERENMQMFSLGAMANWRDWILYTEWVKSTVSDAEKAGASAGYLTLGRQFGSYTPFVTYSRLDKENNSEQKSVALGLKYQLSTASTFKIQIDRVEPTEGEANHHSPEKPAGLFESMPERDSVNMIGIAYDFVF